jgi:hypothetical protein
VAEQTPPETLAITLIEHAYHTQPKPEEYLIRVVAELFAAEPGVLTHISRKLVTDLAEEAARIAPDRADDVIALIDQVQQMWEQQA